MTSFVIGWKMQPQEAGLKSVKRRRMSGVPVLSVRLALILSMALIFGMFKHQNRVVDLEGGTEFN